MASGTLEWSGSCPRLPTSRLVADNRVSAETVTLAPHSPSAHCLRGREQGPREPAPGRPVPGDSLQCRVLGPGRRARPAVLDGAGKASSTARQRAPRPGRQPAGGRGRHLSGGSGPHPGLPRHRVSSSTRASEPKANASSRGGCPDPRPSPLPPWTGGHGAASQAPPRRWGYAPWAPQSSTLPEGRSQARWPCGGPRCLAGCPDTAEHSQVRRTLSSRPSPAAAPGRLKPRFTLAPTPAWDPTASRCEEVRGRAGSALPRQTAAASGAPRPCSETQPGHRHAASSPVEFGP